MRSDKPQFLSPIISTHDIDGWRRLLEQVFDLHEVARQTLSADAVESLWGLAGHSAETVLFETPGTPYGIRLIHCDPASSVEIRSQVSGYDCNALKVIDFYAPDFDKAVARLAAAGFALKDEQADYELLGHRITEAHLWGPDSAVCALLGGPLEFFADFVSVTDRTVSEVMSVSAPVKNPEAVSRFYSTLGFDKVYEYEITDESFQHLVGAESKLHIRAINMGPAKNLPYFGIIHYGLPDGTQKDLASVAQLPNRGLVAATVGVRDLGTIERRCRDQGIEVVAPAQPCRLLPYDTVSSMAVRAPHGVVHQLIELT